VVHYALAGLPEYDYNFNVKYKNGALEVIDLAGTKGYIIKPNGKVDKKKRWIWISPMYLGLNTSSQGEMPHKYYVEPALAKPFASYASRFVRLILAFFRSHSNFIFCITLAL
jgi:hypothetical protein